MEAERVGVCRGRVVKMNTRKLPSPFHHILVFVTVEGGFVTKVLNRVATDNKDERNHDAPKRYGATK